MKKLRRLFIFVPALTLALTSCGFANDSSEPSSTNSPISSSETSSVATNDQEIETIYKLYVANGGTLTYEEWLRTIKGEKGDPGKDGTIIYSGNGSPSNSTGKTGDFYIDLLTWGFYVKDETSWVQKGNLKGPQGGQGETPTININDQGYWVINGQTTNVKATGTNGGQGEEGKSAYEIAVENGFQGTEEEWIESLKGENGSNGSNGTSFRNGTGAPSDSLGINGDTYLDYLNYDLYIKSNGQWVKVGNISGGGGSPAVFYTVSFNANGGSGEQQEFITSGELVLPECTFVAPIGKHFSAWQYSETEYQPGDHLEIDDDATISALWAFNEVAVSFDANGGSGEQDDVVIIPGEYTLPECTFVAPIGKHFASWSYNNNTYQPGEVISVTENVEVNAVWQTNVYTVTWNDHDGTLLRADIVEYGETPVYGSNPTRENDSVYSFEFAGWDPSINIVTGDVTYTATYTRTPLPGSLHITFDGNGADGVMADDYVYPGSLYVLPECGFTNNYRSAQFLGWKVNGEDMVPGAYTFINEDTIIKARYSYRFEVEYTALDGHAVVVDLDKLDGTPDGKRYTLIYDQNRGYWYRDIEVENNVYQVTYYDIIAQNLQNYGHIGLLGSEEDYLFYLGSENHPLVGYDGNGFYYNGDIEYGKAIYLISSYTGWDTLREEYRFSYDEVNHRWYLPFRPIENEMFYTFYRFVIDDYDNPTTSSDNFDISLTPISRCCDIGGNIGSIINPYTIDNIYNSSSLINEYAFVTAYVDSIDDAEMNNGRMDGVVFRNEAGDKTIVNLGLYAYDGIDPDATMCLEPGDEVVFLAYISSTEDSLTNEITYTFDEGGMIVACNGAPLGGKDPDHPSSMTHLQFINYVCPTYKQPFYTEGEVYSIFGADPDNLTKNCWARSANLPILGDSINGIVVMGTDAPYHFANIDEYNAFSSGNARVVFRNEWNDDLQYIACYPYSYYIYEDAYYLLGSFNNWVVMDPAYRLVEDSVNQGVYYLTGLELTEGQTLRVVDSNNAYFPSEGTFHIIEDGIYTISFDSNNNSINAVKTGEYVPEITYYLVGSFCNWELDSDYLMTPDSENNNYYTIKDVALKEGDLVKARTNTGIYFPDGINNDYVVPCDGLYTFYVAGSDLCVTVPDDPNAVEDYIVYGKVGSSEYGKIENLIWNDKDGQFEIENLQLNEGDELKFHIEDTYWLGYDEIDEEYGHPELFTRHNPVNSEDMGGNNIIVNEDGVYSFYFVEQSNHTIKIYAVKENTSSGDEPVDPTPVDPTPDPEPEPDPEPVVIPNYIVYGKVGDNDFNVIKEMSFNDNQWEVTNVELHEGDQIVFHIQDTYWVGYDEIDETSGNRVFFDRNNSADGANNIIVKADSTYSFYLVEQSNHTFKIYAVDENEEEVIIQDAPTSGYHVKIMSGNNVTYVHAYDTGTTSYNKSVYRASNVTLKDGDIIMMYNGNTGLPFNCATSSKLYTSSSASGSFQYISNAGGVRVKKDGTYTIELQLAYGDDSYYIY